MVVSKTSIRERLIGEPLIGFKTETGIAHRPSVTAGPNSETKPEPRGPAVMVLNTEITPTASAIRTPRAMVGNAEVKPVA